MNLIGNKFVNNLLLQEIEASKLSLGGTNVIAGGDLFQFKLVYVGYIFQDIQNYYGPLAINRWCQCFSVH